MKKAADFVLSKAVKEGNITTIQRDEIQRKLTHLLDKEYKNNTQGNHIRKKEFQFVLLFFKTVFNPFDTTGLFTIPENIRKSEVF